MGNNTTFLSRGVYVSLKNLSKTMTKAKTKMKADYTSLSPARNYWMEIMLLCVIVGVAVFSSSSIYRTNNNPGGINAPVATTTTTTKANLVRGGVSNGDAGQEELSSTSVGDTYIKSVTNSFVGKEVEEGGGLLEGCRLGPCLDHNGDEEACKGQGGCYWYSHLHAQWISEIGGLCSPCAGVNCGRHLAPACRSCPSYDNHDYGESYCFGPVCKWHDSIFYDSGGVYLPK